MKDTIFDLKQELTRENITFHFQPNQHLDAIQGAIVKRYKKRQVAVTTTMQLHEHVGGLPSPPVEETKVTLSTPLLTSHEIRTRIQELRVEKHRLFQILKQLMVQEQLKKKRQLLFEQQKQNQKQKQFMLQQQREGDDRLFLLQQQSPMSLSTYFYPHSYSNLS